MHYGEGAYQETEREIQALLGIERELVPPVRPGDEEGALLPAQTADQPGAYSGPYAAGAVWAVVEGRASSSRTASASRSRRPARSAWWSTRATPRRRSSSRPAPA